MPGLDGLRGLACIGIVVLHVWMFTAVGSAAGGPPLLDAFVGELRQGLIAFFVLSAFLLSGPWLAAAREGRPPPRLRRFAQRRALRLLPGYWLAVLGAFALLAQTGAPRAAAAADLPRFAVLAQPFFDDTRGLLVPPAWSLSVEVGFYVLLPLLGWLVLRGPARGTRRRALLVAAGMVAAGLGWTLAATLGGWPPTVTTSLPTYLPVFACGIAAAALPAPKRPARRRALLAAGALLVIANGVWHADGTGLAGHVLRDLPAAVGFAAVVAALAAGPAGLLEWPPVRWLGTVSFGAYLWHMPVLLVLLERGWLPASPPAALAAVLAPTLAVSALSWYGLERPTLRLGQRRSAARTSRATGSPARVAPSMYPAR